MTAGHGAQLITGIAEKQAIEARKKSRALSTKGGAHPNKPN
jgi:hypothetical protein